MSTCRITKDELEQGTESKFATDGLTGTTADMGGRSEADAVRAGRAAIDADEASRAESADAIVSAIGPDSAVRSTAAEQADIVATARGVVSKQDLLLQAQNSADRVAERFSDLVHQYDGTTAGVQSSWLGVNTAVKTALVDEAAAFDDWVLRNFVNPNLDTQSQLLIKSKNMSIARIRALANQYMASIGEMAKNIGEPIADRLGMNTEDVMRILGHAVNAKYAPEGNARLRAGLEQRIADLEEQGKLSKRKKDKYNELRNRLKRLDTFLESDDPKGLQQILAEEAAEGTDVKKLKVLSWGYTNGQARALLDSVRKMGITDEEIEQASIEYARFVRMFRDERMKYDLIAPEVLEKWPEQSERYVPALGRDDAERLIDSNGVSIYDPGHYREAHGRTTAPDSAWDNIITLAHRTAREIGGLDFGDHLAAAYMKDIRRAYVDPNYKGSGLRMIDLRDLKSAGASKSDMRRLYSEAIQGRGGVIARIPQLNANGDPVGFRKVVLQFDPKFNEGTKGKGATGAELNKALGRIMDHGSSTGDNLLQKATSVYGQMFTRFTPGFCLVNGIRDVLERSFHMTNRVYYADDGTKIEGASLFPSYITGLGSALFTLGSVIRGDVKPGSAADIYGREYKSMGLFQQYSKFYSRDRSLSGEDVIAKGGSVAAELRKAPSAVRDAIDSAGGLKDSVVGFLDRMNDFFNNIASYSQYVTLRKHGINAKDAAAATLEMMNLYQSGTHTNIIRALYPFVRPTMQSAAAAARTLGLSYDPRGFATASKRGVAAAATLYGTGLVLQGVLREALGKDDAGNYIYDGMSASQLATAFPVRIPGSDVIFRIPYGYGNAQIVMSMAVNTSRIMRGVGDWRDLAGDFIFTYVRNMLPGNWPEYSFSSHPAEYMLQTVAPAWMQPVTEVATNIGHFGNKVSYAGDEGQAKALQGSLNTPKFYHDLAKLGLNATGVDMAPEQYRSMLTNMLIGPARLIRTYLEGDYYEHRTKGSQSFAGLHPILAAFGGTMLFSDSYNTSRSIFYNTYSRYENDWKRKGLKLTSDNSSDYSKNHPEEKWAFQARVLKNAGYSQDFIEDWLVLAQAQHAIEKLNRSSNKGLKDRFAEGDPSALRSDFRKLSEQYEQIFNQATSQLRLYGRKQ